MDNEDNEKLREPKHRERVIEELGLHNATVRHCLDLWRSGACDRATAMDLAVIFLARENKVQFDMLTDKIAREPVRMIVPVHKPEGS